MNLRNKKHTANNRNTDIKEDVVQLTAVKEFTDYLNNMFIELPKYDIGSHMRVCVFGDIFEFVDLHIDKFKDIPRFSKIFTSIRETSIRLMPDLGTMAMNKGKDPEFAKSLERLSCVLLRVLAKLGTA
jgi:hypothetical protein